MDARSLFLAADAAVVVAEGKGAPRRGIALWLTEPTVEIRGARRHCTIQAKRSNRDANGKTVHGYTLGQARDIRRRLSKILGLRRYARGLGLQ